MNNRNVLLPAGYCRDAEARGVPLYCVADRRADTNRWLIWLTLAQGVALYKDAEARWRQGPVALESELGCAGTSVYKSAKLAAKRLADYGYATA